MATTVALDMPSSTPSMDTTTGSSDIATSAIAPTMSPIDATTTAITLAPTIAPSLLYTIPNPPTTFPKMSHLPLELQFRIYNLATNALEPRTIDAQPKSPGNTIPSLMHACSISRTVARKVYARFNLFLPSHNINATIVINPNRDTLVIGASKPSTYLGSAPLVREIFRFEDAAIVLPRLLAQVKKLTLTQKACQVYEEESGGYPWLQMLIGPPVVKLEEIVTACPKLRELSLLLDARCKERLGHGVGTMEEIDPFSLMQRYDSQLELFRMEEGLRFECQTIQAKKGEKVAIKSRLRLNFKVENHPRFPDNYVVGPILRYGE